MARKYDQRSIAWFCLYLIRHVPTLDENAFLDVMQTQPWFWKRILDQFHPPAFELMAHRDWCVFVDRHPGFKTLIGDITLDQLKQAFPGNYQKTAPTVECFTEACNFFIWFKTGERNGVFQLVDRVSQCRTAQPEQQDFCWRRLAVLFDKHNLWHKVLEDGYPHESLDALREWITANQESSPLPPDVVEALVTGECVCCTADPRPRYRHPCGLIMNSELRQSLQQLITVFDGDIGAGLRELYVMYHQHYRSNEYGFLDDFGIGFGTLLTLLAFYFTREECHEISRQAVLQKGAS